MRETLRMSRLYWRKSVAIGFALAAGLGPRATTAAETAKYEFLAAPQTDLNRVFRLDRTTGEIGACQYGLKESSPVGVTLCYPPGEGARAGTASDYALVASRHTSEGGVFRVDLRSGVMSICFVLAGNVVCTPPAR